MLESFSSAATSAATAKRTGADTGRSSKLRLLTFTTLYPSASQPRHGIFVETRLRHLLNTGAIEARVVAPVPWFPSRASVFGRYAKFARTPLTEDRSGLLVHHPRYIAIPRIGMLSQPRSLAWAAARTIAAIVAEGYEFDAIDAHYFFPDGVAAAYLAQRFGKPFVVTARGSDINLIARLARPRQMILDAARMAGRLIAVSAALKRAMIELGIEAERVVVLRNGVDLDLFRPIPMTEARPRLGLGPGQIVASVGNLVPEKGHDLVLSAIAGLENASGIIVGEGPERQRLQRLASALGISDRIRFLPIVPQDQLAIVYSAVDVLALGSTREGWPNVLLEAMACGTPVVAMDVGGVGEIITKEEVGRLVGRRDASAFAMAIQQLMARPPDRAAIRRYAQNFGWGPVSLGQVELFAELVERHREDT